MIGVLAQQPLVARSDRGIGIGFIAEVVAPEQAAITLVMTVRMPDKASRKHLVDSQISPLSIAEKWSLMIFTAQLA
jgi:hypothetical protein